MSNLPNKPSENAEPTTPDLQSRPDTLAPHNDLHAQVQPPRVVRVNRRTLFMLGAIASGLGALVLVVGFSDHTRQADRAGHDLTSARPTDGLVGEHIRELPKDYTFDVRAAAAGIGYGRNSDPAATSQPAPLSPDQQAAAEERRRLAEARRQFLEQQRKELEQALDSPLVFAAAKRSTNAVDAGSTSPLGNRSQSPPAGDEYEVPQRRNGLDLSMAALMRRSQNNPLTAWESRQMTANDKESFMAKAASVEPYLAKPLIEPLSRYELKAGSVIAGALITGINTDLPGEIIGQVTENVYDTASGQYLLIPQGSRLLGKYQNAVANGQNRALVIWRRLILPNGKSIILEGMPGTDAAGLAGLKDKVDYHMNKLVGAAAMTTALAYAGNLARNPNSGSNGNSNQDVIGDTVAQQTNRIGDKIMDRELDVQPTITIRPGWPFRVLVNKDMILAPYAP